MEMGVTQIFDARKKIVFVVDPIQASNFDIEHSHASGVFGWEVERVDIFSRKNLKNVAEAFATNAAFEYGKNSKTGPGPGARRILGMVT